MTLFHPPFISTTTTPSSSLSPSPPLLSPPSHTHIHTQDVTDEATLTPLDRVAVWLAKRDRVAAQRADERAQRLLSADSAHHQHTDQLRASMLHAVEKCRSVCRR